MLRPSLCFGALALVACLSASGLPSVAFASKSVSLAQHTGASPLTLVQAADYDDRLVDDVDDDEIILPEVTKDSEREDYNSIDAQTQAEAEAEAEAESDSLSSALADAQEDDTEDAEDESAQIDSADSSAIRPSLPWRRRSRAAAQAATTPPEAPVPAAQVAPTAEAQLQAAATAAAPPVKPPVAPLPRNRLLTETQHKLRSHQLQLTPEEVEAEAAEHQEEGEGETSHRDQPPPQAHDQPHHVPEAVHPHLAVAHHAAQNEIEIHPHQPTQMLQQIPHYHEPIAPAVSSSSSGSSSAHPVHSDHAAAVIPHDAAAAAATTQPHASHANHVDTTTKKMNANDLLGQKLRLHSKDIWFQQQVNKYLPPAAGAGSADAAVSAQVRHAAETTHNNAQTVCRRLPGQVARACRDVAVNAALTLCASKLGNAGTALVFGRGNKKKNPTPQQDEDQWHAPSPPPPQAMHHVANRIVSGMRQDYGSCSIVSKANQMASLLKGLQQRDAQLMRRTVPPPTTTSQAIASSNGHTPPAAVNLDLEDAAFLQHAPPEYRAQLVEIDKVVLESIQEQRARELNPALPVVDHGVFSRKMEYEHGDLIPPMPFVTVMHALHHRELITKFVPFATRNIAFFNPGQHREAQALEHKIDALLRENGALLHNNNDNHNDEDAHSLSHSHSHSHDSNAAAAGLTTPPRQLSHASSRDSSLLHHRTNADASTASPLSRAEFTQSTSSRHAMPGSSGGRGNIVLNQDAHAMHREIQNRRAQQQQMQKSQSQPQHGFDQWQQPPNAMHPNSMHPNSMHPYPSGHHQPPHAHMFDSSLSLGGAHETPFGAPQFQPWHQPHDHPMHPMMHGAHPDDGPGAAAAAGAPGSSAPAHAQANENHAELLNDFIMSIRVVSDTSSQVGDPNPSAFLVGEPGTGKTRFVNELGKALGLYVCHASLKRKEARNTAHNLLFGSSSSSHGPAWADAQAVRGIFADCIIQAGHLNPIIFMDEVDGILNGANSGDFEMIQELKHFYNAESHQRKRWLPGVSLEVDTSRITLIYAANKPLTDTALMTRMPSLTFPALSLAQRTKIYESIVRSELPQLGQLFHLTPTQEVEIESRIHAIMPRFVLADKKMFAGVRGGLRAMKRIVLQAMKQMRSTPTTTTGSAGGSKSKQEDALLAFALQQLATFKAKSDHEENQQRFQHPAMLGHGYEFEGGLF